MDDPRGTVDLVGHQIYVTNDLGPGALPQVDNIIIRSSSPAGRWIEESTLAIGEWRGRFQSAYVHWCLAINGLHLAAAKYDDPEWYTRNEFYVTALRGDAASKHSLQQILQWDGQTAADGHKRTIGKLSTWGVIELFAYFEELVLDLYRAFLNHHPEKLLIGDEYKTMRRLRKEADTDPALLQEWEAAWNARLESWSRKRAYQRLSQVLLAYMRTAGLEKPTSYTDTSPETWAESLDVIAILRNCLVHGARTVPTELGELCQKPHSLQFGYVEGEPIVVGLAHLQVVELFANQLLTALNLSLVQHPDAAKPNRD